MVKQDLAVFIFRVYIIYFRKVDVPVLHDYNFIMYKIAAKEVSIR